jgi:peptide/nickel transport system substrate-binding protein
MSRTRALRATAAAGVVAAIALVVVIGAGAGAKSGQIKNGGTLVIGLADEPDALDPTLARTFSGRMVFLHMCEKLYDLDSKLHVVPQLAAALPTVSKDKLTYTIKLRTGIKFNDGTAFNAAAVKTSLERHLTLKGSVRASEISPIASVETSGANTVVLHLKTPYSPLTAQLADRAGMIMSPKQLAALGDKFASNPVCVGAFGFKDRVAGDHITLTKSNFYYGKANVHLNSIVFKILVDQNARTQNLRAGDIQVEDRVQATDVPTLQKAKSTITVVKAPTIGYQGITINIGNKNGLLKPYSNVGSPLAKSQYLRTAFDLALDRTTINKVVFGGLNLPDCYPISPVSPWYSTTKGLQCNLHAQVATAQKLVKASGIANPKVTLTIGTDTVAARLGQVIQAMEKEAGIDVSLSPTEFVTSLNRADAGNFDAFAVGWSGRVDPDGNIFGFVSTPGTLNDSGYSNQQLDYILNNARRSVTDKSRTTLYAAAMKIIHRQRPLIYLYHPVNYYGVSNKVDGVKVYGDGLIRASNAGFK